ncbi:MAG: 30S ribosomal protein S27e [archaeon]
MPKTKSKFIRVQCQCGYEQTIFGTASSEVKCAQCDTILAVPTGGRTDIKSKIVAILD